MLLTKVLLMELRTILRTNMSKKTVDQVLALRWGPVFVVVLSFQGQKRRTIQLTTSAYSTGKTS